MPQPRELQPDSLLNSWISIQKTHRSLLISSLPPWLPHLDGGTQVTADQQHVHQWVQPKLWQEYYTVGVLAVQLEVRGHQVQRATIQAQAA